MVTRGIDLDADFGIWRKAEMRAREFEQVRDLLRGQIRGRASAPMELHYRALARDAAGHMLDFAFQDFDVRRGDALIFLDNYVAGAKEAQAFAKWQVHVERERRLRTLRLGVHFFQVAGAESIVPDGSGGITGVARAGAIVAGEKFFVNAQLVAHAFEARIGQCHNLFLSATATRAKTYCCDAWTRPPAIARSR